MYQTPIPNIEQDSFVTNNYETEILVLEQSERDFIDFTKLIEEGGIETSLIASYGYFPNCFYYIASVTYDVTLFTASIVLQMPLQSSNDLIYNWGAVNAEVWGAGTITYIV